MNNLQVIEHKSQRVLTTAQLAEGYETDIATISNNFNRNKERYIVGKHYYCLENEQLKEFKAVHQFDEQFKYTPKVYLWTEKGALLHAKSLNTDKAWEQYDNLVDTYFKMIELAADLNELSPELRTLINLEVKQRQQERAICEVNRKVDGISDIIATDTTSWRDDTNTLIVRIAQAMGGNSHISEVRTSIYNLLDMRASVCLETRLTNKRRRMADEGVSKTARANLNKVDIIAEDKKLIEIYTALVKEMAIKHNVWK